MPRTLLLDDAIANTYRRLAFFSFSFFSLSLLFCFILLGRRPFPHIRSMAAWLLTAETHIGRPTAQHVQVSSRMAILYIVSSFYLLYLLSSVPCLLFCRFVFFCIFFSFWMFFFESPQYNFIFFIHSFFFLKFLSLSFSHY